MARPRKQTIDYFPHYCNHKKTMFIVEQRYGNDGYAFWFKLLEMLGDTEGHFLDLNDVAMWEFLQSKTRLSESFCIDILNLLAKLDAIDAGLWEKKIVWCQNFVDGIVEVYKNRRVNLPEKPDPESFYSQKPRCVDVSTARNPQSKVNESKVNEMRVRTARARPINESENQETEPEPKKPQHGESLTVTQHGESQTKPKMAGPAAGTEAREQPSTTLAAKWFDEFWAVYPRKVGKKATGLSWKKIRPDAELHDRIMAAVRKAKLTEQWQRDGGRFIPNPATWLNQGRWDDEYGEVTQNGAGSRYSAAQSRASPAAVRPGFRPSTANWEQEGDRI